jgi:hypothetical protein
MENGGRFRRRIVEDSLKNCRRFLEDCGLEDS